MSRKKQAKARAAQDVHPLDDPSSVVFGDPSIKLRRNKPAGLWSFVDTIAGFTLYVYDDVVTQTGGYNAELKGLCPRCGMRDTFDGFNTTQLWRDVMEDIQTHGCAQCATIEVDLAAAQAKCDNLYREMVEPVLKRFKEAQKGLPLADVSVGENGGLEAPSILYMSTSGIPNRRVFANSRSDSTVEIPNWIPTWIPQDGSPEALRQLRALSIALDVPLHASQGFLIFGAVVVKDYWKVKDAKEALDKLQEHRNRMLAKQGQAEEAMGS